MPSTLKLLAAISLIALSSVQSVPSSNIVARTYKYKPSDQTAPSTTNYATGGDYTSNQVAPVGQTKKSGSHSKKKSGSHSKKKSGSHHSVKKYGGYHSKKKSGSHHSVKKYGGYHSKKKSGSHHSVKKYGGYHSKKKSGDKYPGKPNKDPKPSEPMAIYKYPGKPNKDPKPSEPVAIYKYPGKPNKDPKPSEPVAIDVSPNSVPQDDPKPNDAQPVPQNDLVYSGGMKHTLSVLSGLAILFTI